MDEIEELKKLPGKEVMEKVLVGWSELLDDDNQPVDFNEDNLRALLNIPPALLAMSAAFWESLSRHAKKTRGRCPPVGRLQRSNGCKN